MEEAGFDLEHYSMVSSYLWSCIHRLQLLAPAIPTMEQRALPDPGEGGRNHAAAFTPCCVILEGGRI